MKTYYWFILIILGIIISYIPRINITIPSISIGAIILIIGVFGLTKSLFK